MTGSVLVIAGETKEEVLKLLQSDIYTQGGAWNVENATITPVS